MQNYRPVPFYFLNTTDPETYTPEAVAASIQRLQAQGYGGVILFNKPPTGFDREAFLGEGWFQAIGNFLAAARKADFRLWINDGWDYPPGDAGDRIRQRNPELVQHRLILKDGKAEVVTCDWGFPAFEEPESSQLFIELVYEEYYRRFGEFFGNPLVGFFSDADNRRSNHFTRRYMDGKPYFPWSRSFAEGFREKYGYDLVPRLTAVLSGKDPQSAEDYWEYASQLYQNWFRNNHEWCSRHGIRYSFHSSDTGPLPFSQCDRSSVFTEGEALSMLKNSDMPGVDHELEDLDGGTHYDGRYRIPFHFYGAPATPEPFFYRSKWDLRAKYAASAAWLYGRKRVLCEAFAATNWSATPARLRQIAAWQIMQGINFFVPHAVHHRFFGPTKFFAPPEMMHADSIREFNDFLTRYSFIAAQGEYDCPVTVRDTSRDIWRGSESTAIYSLCDRLNRMACNYVIVPESSDYQLDPSDEEPVLPHPFAEFTGGELAWMQRRLSDGTRYILAANLWSDEELTGTIRYDGKSCPVALAPGEIAVLGGPYESYRRPVRISRSQNFQESMAVLWDAPNTVPLPGSAVFELKDSALPLTLLLPEGSKASVNGLPLQNGKACRVYDDAYCSYELRDLPQEFRLELSPVEFHTPAFLQGEFDVDLHDETRFYEYYNQRIGLPGEFRITLSPRRKQLLPGSWTEQGAPFYSGKATCSFKYQCSGESLLSLNLGGCSAELRIDGKPMGHLCFPPFRFQFPPLSGEHQFEIQVVNTLANRLEMYRVPSGILNLKFSFA